MRRIWRSLVPDFWMLAHAAPLLIVLAAIFPFGVDLFNGDELFYIPRLVKITDGTFGFYDLFELHHNHRPAIPFGITAAFVFTTGWHGPYKYLLAVFFAGASAYLIHRLTEKTMPHITIPTRRLFTLFTTATLLSLTQYTVWTQSMFLSLTLLMCCAIGVTVLLSEYPSPGRIIGAAALCTIATLTLHQGFLLWFLSLALIFFYRRFHPLVFAWLTLAITTTICYHINFAQGGFESNLWDVVHTPSALLQFVAAFLGAPLAPTHLLIATIVGTALIALAMYLIYRTIRVQELHQLSLPWISLLVYTSALAVSTAIGRVWIGPFYALRPRYLAMSSLFVIAVMGLALIHIRSTSAQRAMRILLTTLICVSVIYSGLAIDSLRLRSKELERGRTYLLTTENLNGAQLKTHLKNTLLSSDELELYVWLLKDRGIFEAVY